MKRILFKYPEHIEDIAFKMEKVLSERYDIQRASYHDNLKTEMWDNTQYFAIVVLIDVRSSEDHWVHSLAFHVKDKPFLIVSLNYTAYTEEYYSTLLSWVLVSEGAKRRFINRLPSKLQRRIRDYEKSNQEPNVFESCGGCLLVWVPIILLFYFSIKYGISADFNGTGGGPDCSGRKC